MTLQEKLDIECSIPKIIGITGYIGSGKSIVSRILRCNGFSVYDCDSAAAWLMNNDISVKQQLIEILGEKCYQINGMLDRIYVSKIIFGDDNMRMRINSIVHKAVSNDFKQFVENKTDKVFIESAILATSGLYKVCNEIWIVDAPENIRLLRVMERNHFSEQEVRKRMLAQKDELIGLPEDKIIVIENDGYREILEKIITLLYSTKCQLEYSFNL
ncbi:MAG: dephospho-CoA kinase [Bacteroides sp.]|nr:dephospho-CoA kinase [Bacteroides sp.]